MTSNIAISGMHVLIVEDEYIIASAIFDDLERAGAIPLEPCYSVLSAFQKILGSKKIDAAIMDFRLRGEVSTPIAEELERCGIPFIFLTGNDKIVRTLFPSVPIHLKPADMEAVMLSLLAVVADRASRAKASPSN